jgi:Tol biopolymer transport system component
MLGFVPRAIVFGALLAGLVGLAAIPSSAALPGSGKIAYAVFNDGLYTVNPDGSDVARLRSGPVSDPRWSPDGSKIAFTEYTGSVGEFRLVVMNADGTGEHVIVTTGGIGLGKQPWSPDGSRIAWGPRTGEAGDVYTASAAGGDVRRISYDNAPKESPSWSPTGSSLVYASMVLESSSMVWELFVARDDGTPPVQITNGSGLAQSVRPSWSPNESAIAFVRQRSAPFESAIYVVHPDGTELHRVVDVAWSSTGEPVWSPDGTKIAYTDGVNGFYSRGGHAGQEIFVADADGSGVRRLTEGAPRGFSDFTPSWSPDGDRILFLRPAGGPATEMNLATMNSDGTCEGGLGTTVVQAAPSWQPVPGGGPVGEKTCRAVSLEGRGSPNRYRSKVYLYATVTNEGTEPLTHVMVTISNPRHDLALSGLNGCFKRDAKAICSIFSIGRGKSITVGAVGAARRVGRDQRGIDIKLLAQLQVTADGPLLPTQRETDVVPFTPDRCSSSDPGRGRIDGTRFPDRICGRRGADDIHPLDGKDFVFAGAGPDRIFARDIYGDVIRCGPGKDIVIADRKDIVARDCERVTRG